MTEFQRERFADVLDEALPLIKANYAETAIFPDIPLDLDVERYAATDAAGLIWCFTARRAGELIGYAVFLLAPSMHCRTSRQALQDVFYIAPKARGPRTAMRFSQFCDAQLQAAGAQAVLQNTAPGKPFGRLLKRLGFTLASEVYVRRLDNGN